MPKKTLEVFEVVVFRFGNGWMAAAACKRLQSIILASEGHGTAPNEVVFKVKQGVAPLLIGEYLHPYGVLVDAYEIDSSDDDNSNW
jgi:hypothetical protein